VERVIVVAREIILLNGAALQPFKVFMHFATFGFTALEFSAIAFSAIAFSAIAFSAIAFSAIASV
jgi:hypothetical protein